MKTGDHRLGGVFPTTFGGEHPHIGGLDPDHGGQSLQLPNVWIQFHWRKEDSKLNARLGEADGCGLLVLDDRSR
ncbi:hypothetical protein MINTM019_28440 [Mycobacterium paraintracellulare]|nr:hypothetical protein MINTM019_28440 [Mycobacterium paraintracellulare]